MKKGTNNIYYERPAERWTECCPIGSGRLGAMLYGKVSEDLVQLNEETIWAGCRQDVNNPKAAAALPKLRQLIFEGKIQEAQTMARECMISVPPIFGAYEPFADLIIQTSDLVHAGQETFPKSYDYTDYNRSLSLAHGISRVEFSKNDVRYHREYFASYPDNVIVIRYTNDGGLPMDLFVSLNKGSENVSEVASDNTIFYSSRLGEKGVDFCGAVRVVAEPAPGHSGPCVQTLSFTQSLLIITGASAVTFYVAVTSDFWGGDKKDCFLQLDRAVEKGYDAVKETHIRDFSGCYERFYMELGSGEETEPLPVPKWLDEIHSGHIKPDFTELYMNYTRYLLISASRPGCLPSNLQGVWNDKVHPMCESDYHTNINIQMNYWPAHSWGLDECVRPLVDWLEALVPTGETAARKNYGANGWTVHHCSDIFGYASPNFDVVGLWPVGGPWMCRHLYEYWLYTKDYEMMRSRLYPIIRGSAAFILDFLVEAPKGSACPGALVTNPSVSPENEYLLPDGGSGMLTYAAAMDIEIITDLFDLCKVLIKEIQKLEPDFDSSFYEAIDNAGARLPKIKISARHGGIQEWIEDYEEKDPGHRHVSQLYGVYPGTSINPEKTPELAKAAVRTIERKYEAGYDGQGWSLGWIAAICARLGQGDKGYDVICEIYRRHILPNLMINAHGFPQVGDAMGGPSAILEMLVQSHGDEIVLLPALPKALPEGKIRGMRLRGGVTLDMDWKDGRLLKAVVCSEMPGTMMPVRVGTAGAYEIIEENQKTVITPM